MVWIQNWPNSNGVMACSRLTSTTCTKPQWVGYYEAKLEREARYREMMYAHLRKLREKTGLGALQLIPETTATEAL